MPSFWLKRYDSHRPKSWPHKSPEFYNDCRVLRVSIILSGHGAFSCVGCIKSTPHFRTLGVAAEQVGRIDRPERTGTCIGGTGTRSVGTMSAVIRVVKVGGSLLDWPGLPRALSSWFDSQPPSVNVIISGGGRWVDAIRDSDKQFDLGDKVAHRLSLKAMTTTAFLVSSILEDSQFVESPTELVELVRLGHSELRLVFACESVLTSPQFSKDVPLAFPENWTVTSDSIAAIIARWLGAEELVLLKSVLPQHRQIAGVASTGIVDEFFPTAAHDIPNIRAVNLRHTEFMECTIAG